VGASSDWAVEIRVHGGLWLSRGFSLGELPFHAPRDIVRKSEEGLSKLGDDGTALGKWEYLAGYRLHECLNNDTINYGRIITEYFVILLSSEDS
jgi:hypothetical protein